MYLDQGVLTFKLVKIMGKRNAFAKITDPDQTAP